MTNLIKLFINVSVLRAWCRKGDIMICNLCPASLYIFSEGAEVEDENSP